MSELATQERLQPSVLDRLMDNEPQRQREAVSQRSITTAQLRESVLRDLTWLFNTENLEAVHPLGNYPEVAKSVLNYGLPVLSGRTATSLDLIDLEDRIRQIIIEFEPRILPDSLIVRGSHSTDEMTTKALRFELEGNIWALPIPVRFLLQTELDIDGNFSISRRLGG